MMSSDDKSGIYVRIYLIMTSSDGISSRGKDGNNLKICFMDNGQFSSVHPTGMLQTVQQETLHHEASF